MDRDEATNNDNRKRTPHGFVFCQSCDTVIKRDNDNDGEDDENDSGWDVITQQDSSLFLRGIISELIEEAKRHTPGFPDPQVHSTLSFSMWSSVSLVLGYFPPSLPVNGY